MLLSVPHVHRPSRSAIERVKIELERRLGASRVLTSPESCAAYRSDDSDVSGPLPDAVVIAESPADVAATLAVADECDVPVTPRAGGTGRTGGAVPVAGGIVLATHALARIKEIDRANLVAIVEPGVITGDLHAAVEAEGLFYAPDPNSLDSCRIGGNLAENAGGPRAFRYGVTRDWVLGLQACLVGGRVIRTGKRTVKGVTGYDVTALLIGSEGTLAVFTEATLRLAPKPPLVGTELALFSDMRAAANAVGSVVSAGIVPRCMEMLDSPTLDAVRNAGVPIDERAGAMLLVEVDGESSETLMLRVGEVLTSCAGCIDVVVAQDGAQRDRLWAARRMLSKATRRLARHKLSEDIVVPRTRMADLLARADEIGDSTGVRHLAYGHAGDGNLHVNFLWNDDSERPAVDRAIELLMRATVELGGTLSGEHGIGVSKAPYLGLEQSVELIALQRDIKRTFDPKDLLNPGKIFPAEGHRAC
ncbi:MAG TPA: FAD-linked oxidase C-terminal domain-containing protein [Polyangiaceae bacterium]|nr:FAD-linked oxidase C-terminal domain-containing protein [Polyangiaceae bacterium]